MVKIESVLGENGEYRSVEVKTQKYRTILMKFIEMNGTTLEAIVESDELRGPDLSNAGVTPESIIRVNEQGDIEIRRANKWSVIGGLLGNFEDRVKRVTGFDWV